MPSYTKKRLLQFLVLHHLLKTSEPRRLWVHPLNQQREINGEHLKLEEMYSKYPDRFFGYTRLTPALFDKLLSIVGPLLKKQDTKFRTSVSPRIRLLIILRFLATGDNIRTIATNFSMGLSTVWTIIQEGLPILWTQLKTTYVKRPTKEGWGEIANDFNLKWNYPNCIGAIDGKHVVITAPRKSGSLYLNYKGTFSIVLLATCDAKYRFTYIDVGGYGKQSDGGVFFQSSLGKELINGTIDIPQAGCLPNSNQIIPYHFIGDEAFPLTIYMMRPFPGKSLTNERRIFNYRLSRARRCIENAFGIMAARFRVFHRPIKAEPKTVEKIVLATVALHNFILTEEENQTASQRTYNPPGFADADDFQNGTWRQADQGHALQNISSISVAAHERMSKKIREDLMDYFNNAGQVDWQNERAGVTNL